MGPSAAGPSTVGLCAAGPSTARPGLPAPCPRALAQWRPVTATRTSSRARTRSPARGGARRPPPRTRLWWWVLVLVALGVTALRWPQTVDASPRYVVPAAELAAAEQALASMPVRGRAPMTGYDRSQFGDGWADTDLDGCSTREEILLRDLLDVTTDGCTVLTGTLPDPYSGADVRFERGQDSTDVQIDHVVALADAWQKGAQQWPAALRVAFANDPLNLLAVDGGLNQQKGAGDAATWLPPSRGYRCPYVLRQITVKVRYGLWVTAAERDALDRELGRCVPADG